MSDTVVCVPWYVLCWSIALGCLYVFLADVVTLWRCIDQRSTVYRLQQ